MTIVCTLLTEPVLQDFWRELRVARSHAQLSPSPATGHPAPATESPARPTEHPAPATPSPARPTEHPAPATPSPARPTEHPARATPSPARPTEHPARATAGSKLRYLYLPLFLNNLLFIFLFIDRSE
jgi:hypothetical protein